MTEFLIEKTVPPCPKFRPGTAGEELLGIASRLGFEAPPKRQLDTYNYIDWAEDTVEAVENTLSTAGAAYQSYRAFAKESNQIKSATYIKKIARLAQNRSHY